MISAIEDKVLAEIVARVNALKKGAADKGAGTLLTQSAFAVAVLKGTFERVTKRAWRQDVIVSVLVKFKNMQSEEARRKGINPLVQGVVQALSDQTLGLKIKPLAPRRFEDVTTEAKYDAGLIEYLVEFGTSFITEKQTDEEADDLLTVALDYLFKPGDDTVDAEDLVSLPGPQ